MNEIVIACPSYLVREGFKRIIAENNHYKVVGEIGTSKEFWIKLYTLSPDILVIDCNHKNFFEPVEISRVKEHLPSAKILLISNDEDKKNILNTIKLGVLGYLTKECDSSEIYKALDTISLGQKFICNRVLEILIEKYYDAEEHQNSFLSSRENEIIKLITIGNSNQEIAEKLFISIHTVYTHRKNIMKKLNLKSPVELVLYAFNSGLVKS